MTYGSGGWSGQAQGGYGIADRSDDPWLPTRIEVGYRVREMSRAHVKKATFDRPEGRLPGPHALGWLYATPNSQPGQIKSVIIDVASRMFAWSDDDRPGYNVKNSTLLVQDQVRILGNNVRTERLDPIHFTDRQTEPLTPGAAFVGIALSSLGGDGLDWASLKPGAFGFGIEMPAVCTVRLIDGTWMMLSRSGRGEWKVECNRALGYMSAMDWSWKPNIPPDYVPRPGGVEQFLDQLVEVTYDTYQQRHKHRPPRQRGAHG